MKVRIFSNVLSAVMNTVCPDYLEKLEKQISLAERYARLKKEEERISGSAGRRYQDAADSERKYGEETQDYKENSRVKMLFALIPFVHILDLVSSNQV